ncbi:hypothetical protein [Streptacidiphilus sp. EB103A]|uniref:hypothetical protein n=1 Tax=Streptacidiphilus sp. EB103A TaxID=3156275 RepID=UPI0035171599
MKRSLLTFGVAAATATAVLGSTVFSNGAPASPLSSASKAAGSAVCQQLEQAATTAQQNGGVVDAAALLPSTTSAQVKAAAAGTKITLPSSANAAGFTTSSGAFYKSAQDQAVAAAMKNGKLSAAQEQAAQADMQSYVAQGSSCISGLHVTGATLSYLESALIGIAAEAVVASLAGTLICALTGPAGCVWGVRFAGFLGGFVDSLAFQYAYEGKIDKTSVTSAFVDAFAQLAVFSGLTAAEERYVERGVRATFQNFGNAIRGFVARYTGMGTIMGDVSQELTAIAGQSIFAGAASTGHATFESALAPTSGQAIAGPVWITTESNGGSSSVTSDDLAEGGNAQWVMQELAPNSRGDVGYRLAQGNNCLTNQGNRKVPTMVACASSGSTLSKQTWYMEGQRLISSTGDCLSSYIGEIAYACSSDINTGNNNYYSTNLIVVTPVGGNWTPGEDVAYWHNNWKANDEWRW